ncbi:MAG: RNA polymerase subunit sigma-24, partial [Prosthecobacter sp.]|nr:RNA polymerase subunit sigma-24 [Prosthecobacter sp.]
LDEPHLARQRDALDACVSKMDRPQRDLLMEAYQPQASIQKIATRSGRTVGGFYQWLHRVRRLLLDCIRRELNRETLS